MGKEDTIDFEQLVVVSSKIVKTFGKMGNLFLGIKTLHEDLLEWKDILSSKAKTEIMGVFI